MQKRNKKAAIELSINTIVIIVLAMSMLVLGLVLVKNIFTGATDVTKMTEDQVKNQVSKMFSDERPVVIYPDSGQIEVKQGKPSGFRIGIKNLRSGLSTDTKFSYAVVVSDGTAKTKCGVSEKELESLISVGISQTGIPIPSGGIDTPAVLFDTQVGDPICIVNYRVNVKVNSENYASANVIVNFKA